MARLRRSKALARGLVLGGLAVVLCAPLTVEAAGAVRLTLDEQYPLRGEPVNVRVFDEQDRPMAGATVVALYRPNSQTSFEEVLPTTGVEGTIAWSPQDAGIVTLSAHRAPPGQDGDAGETLATLDVAVRFGGFPASGLAIMILAGLFLFGGAGFGFAMLFKR